ncbi:MAG: type II toxin-antitoxin system mRNA interferase toxin, RelE/StbE family [Coleofasciculaceae cyanobacterium SM2_1_6]|nr:type II toxin-antitoxin system mRNA interferase toxin, RelE/StbE family [Coleofasciculaceae cyanobacterium SM2_1_6]
MRQIGWTPKSLRAYKRLVRQNPQLRVPMEETLRQLAIDPFHPTLKTHKLSGEFDGIWSASINYSYRVLFKFNIGKQSENAIILLNLGNHDDVY